LVLRGCGSSSKRKSEREEKRFSERRSSDSHYALPLHMIKPTR
jgi:hypothetical protein